MVKNVVKMGVAAGLVMTCMLGVAGCASQQGGSANGGSASAAPAASASSNGADSAKIAPASETISVYSREDGSGTRGAFVELFELEEKDAAGNKMDITTPDAAITNSTSVMMTSVASDPAAIGYISLGSLNDTVKAVDIEGVEASAENVKNGSYQVSRAFNIVTGGNLSPVASDFIKFIMSKDGQAIVTDNNYVAVDDVAPAYTASGASGKVVVAGSSSVTPVMEKLAERYKALNPDAAIEVQQSDSTTGVNMTVEGTCDIGMASRDLKDSEKSSGVSATTIAQDGIAIIVSPQSAVSNLSKDQVKAIFSGETTDWADILG